MDLKLTPANKKPLKFPEGPVALGDGSVLFVEIEGQTLSCLRPDGSVDVVAKLPGGPNGVAIGPDGAAWVCNNGGVYSFIQMDTPNGKITIPSPAGPNPDHKGGWIQRVDLKTGAVTDFFRDKGLISPDDIVFDKRGGFWFTDTGKQYPDRIEKGGLYYVPPGAATLNRVAEVPSANGVGLSPDGNTLYVADTLFARLWKCTLDPDRPGAVVPVEPLKLPGDVLGPLPGYTLVDSLKIGADGRIWQGTIRLEGGCITIFDETGAVADSLPVADPFATNLCFGGPNLTDLWITASSTGMIYKAPDAPPGLKLNFNAQSCLGRPLEP